METNALASNSLLKDHNIFLNFNRRTAMACFKVGFALAMATLSPAINAANAPTDAQKISAACEKSYFAPGMTEEALKAKDQKLTAANKKKMKQDICKCLADENVSGANSKIRFSDTKYADYVIWVMGLYATKNDAEMLKYRSTNQMFDGQEQEAINACNEKYEFEDPD